MIVRTLLTAITAVLCSYAPSAAAGAMEASSAKPAPCVKMRSGEGYVCMKFSKAAIKTAGKYGLHLADPFIVVKQTLIQQGWQVDLAYSSEDAPLDEVMCGRGWDAVCSTAFKRGNETLYLTMSGTNEGMPLISVETAER